MEINKNVSITSIPYRLILSASFILLLALPYIFGGGWEIYLFGAPSIIILLVIVRFLASFLKENNSKLGATLLSLIIILVLIISIRLMSPVITDGDPLRVIDSFSFLLFKETPDLPNNYDQTLSFLLLITVIYFLGSLNLLKKSLIKNSGKVDLITSTIIIVSSVILLAYPLTPLVSSWQKTKQPEHIKNVAEITIDDISSIEMYYKDSFIDSCEFIKSKHSKLGVACRATENDFIVYYKINDEYGYACADHDRWKGIVRTEPTELSCNGKASPINFINSETKITGSPVDGAYTHINTYIGSFKNKDCGILEYKNDNDRAVDVGVSDCFNQAIASCQTAVISGVVDGLVTTYQLEDKNDQCIVTTHYFKKISDSQIQFGANSCVINPDIGWSSLSDCFDLDWTPTI